MDKTIYHFHPNTFEYIGVGEADVSPLDEDELLIPANSTRTAPPPVGEHEAAVYEKKSDSWHVLPDYRNAALYSTIDGQPVTVVSLGPQPADTTNQPRPSVTHEWVDGNWTLNIKMAQEFVWAHIKAKRDAIKSGGVKVGTKWYHTDTESRIQHLGLLEKARVARAAGGTDATRLQALGQDIKWKTMDGSFIYLTVKHAEDIFAAVTDLDAAAFAAAETHRAAMEASADPAAYDFSAGWPATFGG